MDNFAAKLELRIDWSEIDNFGHVNNLAVIKYVQAARVNYLEMIGLMQMQAREKMGPILASISCRFRKPLFYPGTVMAYSKVDLIKNTSFRMQHKILDNKGEVVAEAEDIIVFFDFRKNAKTALPNPIRERIGELENGKIDSRASKLSF